MRQSAQSHQQLVVRPCLPFFFFPNFHLKAQFCVLSGYIHTKCTVCLCNKLQSESNEKLASVFADGVGPNGPLKIGNHFRLYSQKKKKKKNHFRLAYNIQKNVVFLFRCPPCAMRINGSDRGRRCGFSPCVYQSGPRDADFSSLLLCLFVCVSVNWRFPATDNRLLSFSLFYF